MTLTFQLDQAELACHNVKVI